MAPGGPIGGSTRKEVSGARSWSPTASRRACTTPYPTRRPTRPTQAMSGGSRLHGGPGVSGAAAVAAPAAPSNRADDACRPAVRSPGPCPRGPLHPGARAGPGWHGDGVPRHRREARARRRDQAAGARHARLPRERPVPTGSPARRPAVPSPHRAAVRSGRSRWPPVLRDGVRGRRVAAAAAQSSRTTPGRRRRPHRGRGRRRAAVRPRKRRDPPRRQAREHPPVPRPRPGERLRNREADGGAGRIGTADVDRRRTARAFVDALAAPAPERRAPTRPFRWIATAFGAAILGWIVWRGSRVHPPPGMVLVPAGLYPVGGGGRGGPSRDSTAVQLDAYFIDSAEVGVAAYRRFLDATRAGPPWTQAPPDQLPVTGILWSEASAYCAWRQRGGRLPTEDEWEAAARRPHGFQYPWGNGWEGGRVNVDSLREGFAPVGAGSPGRSWVGAVDLIGNAWEWTAAAASDARGQPGHGTKGGAFDTPSANATAAYRAVLPDRRAWLAHTGFRCARGVAVVPEPVPQPASVAVLYFETADTASAYLADGITEAIITSLGRVERLSVKSRNAVRRFRGAVDDPGTLGRALDVAYLVSGSVGRPGRGQSPAVTVELLRASDGVHVWGGQYESRDAALQTIPQAVARAVATAITGALRPVERTALASRPPRDPGAYDRFLRANYELAQRTPRAVRRAIDQYESALRLDPGFTPALARVAVGYPLFLDWGWEYPGLSSEAVLSREFDAADRALQQDSASADAWMARGCLLSFRNPL